MIGRGWEENGQEKGKMAVLKKKKEEIEAGEGRWRGAKPEAGRGLLLRKKAKKCRGRTSQMKRQRRARPGGKRKMQDKARRKSRRPV